MVSSLVIKRIFPCRIVLRRMSTDMGAVWRYVSVNRLFLVLGWGRTVPIILRNIVAESAIGA